MGLGPVRVCSERTTTGGGGGWCCAEGMRSDPVCEQCGDVGITELLLHCTNCKNASRHRYCFPTVLFESIVEWLCSDCLLKHDEAIKSLEDVSNQRLIWGTQVGSSILGESNVMEKEVTKGLWSWGYRRNRSCPGRKDHSDANTKKFLGGDTFNHGHRVNRLLNAGSNSSDARTKHFENGDALNSREIFSGEISENNYSEKKGEDRSDHLICTLDIDGTSHSALDHAYKTEEHNHFLDPIGKPTLNYMECPDLLKEKDGCFSPSVCVEGSIQQGRTVDIFSFVNDVELSHPTIVEKTGPTLVSVEQPDCCGPILESIEKSHPFKAVGGLLYKQKSILTTKIPPNHAHPIRGSDLKTWNAELSSPTNEREDTLENEGAERKCVVADELVNHTLENCTAPNPSMVNDCLVYNEGNPDETNRRPAEPLLSTKHLKIQRGMSGEAYHIYDDHSARGNSWRGNETSNLKSGEGDKDGRNLKSNVGKTSSSAGKKLPHRHVLQVESINNGSLSSMYVSPCESTKVNPRRPRNQSNSHTPCEAKYQKTVLIKNKNVYDARSRSGRPAASLKDNQKMPWKNNGSNDENVEISKLRRHKKRDKSLLLKSSCAKRVTEVDQMEPSRQPDHTNSDAFLKVSSKTKEVPVANYVEPKKRRRLFLSNDVEDADVMQVEDLNPRSCDNNSQLKKQRRSMEKRVNNQIRCVEKNKEVLRKRNLNRQSSKNHKHVKEQRCIEANEDKNGHVKKQRRYMGIGVKNQRRCVEKSEKAPQPENLRRRCSKNRKQVKKQRSAEANQNQNAVVGYIDAGCAKNDGSVLPSQTAVVKDHSALSKMPVMPEHICVQPIDKPYWTGIMKIGRDYIPLAAHLSSKAGKRVQELLRSLPPIMKMTEHALPKCLEAPKPIADSIVLYFFSGDTRPNKELDQVVKHVADSTIVLETVVGLAKLLLFPSVVLPEEYQTYQGKHYLWAVFEQTDKIRKLASAKQDCTAHVMEEEQVQEQRVFDQHDKPQGVTLEQEMPLVNQAVRSENQPLLDANRGIGKEALLSNGAPSAHMKALVSENISPDHGQPCSNSEARPLELCGFVRRTPRSVQLIQEMQKEGAIVFAVKQGLTKPVSVV